MIGEVAMFCKNHLNVINIENSAVQEEIIICDTIRIQNVNKKLDLC